jgi:NADH-quinone oxidoreductase subunit J
LLLLGVMVYALIDGFEDTRIAGSGPGKIGGTANVLLSDRIFSTYALPFWALSFVLLAAVIGAIVLARKD